MRAVGTKDVTTRTSLRSQTLVALLALGTFVPDAVAGNILRNPGRGGAATPDAAALQAAAAAAQAAALAHQAASPLRQAFDAIRAWQAQQDAARAAALGGVSTVPNGLGPGGLQVSFGADQNPTLWQGADRPWAVVGADGRTEVTVTQSAPKAILTWNTFNVGRETDLHFDQSAGGSSAAEWVALNRVDDPLARPSQILGSIKAEGQVYVINRSGIIFGGASQVNVATLVASSLDLAGATLDERNARFQAGLLSVEGLAFGGDALAAGAGVTVEAGARVAAAPYGQVLLLGEQVTNRGSLEASDGQVVLAAGSDVYLGRGTAQGLRGYLAEVNRAGLVVNEGMVSTPRGDISIKGQEIDQRGLLTATTSGDAAGTIHLGATFTSNPFGSAIGREPTTVAFGAGSVTQILPDLGAKKVAGGAPFTPSALDVRAETIDVLDGATLYVPSGGIALTATMSSLSADPAVPDPSRVYLGAGARLDVSGLRDVEVAMAQNEIKAELRASELRDNPAVRDGPLRGQPVYFDGRLGSHLGDFSGYYALVERGVEQLMTRGGTVSLTANEIITRQGSVIDLSGGSLRYLDGFIRSTMLVDPTGKLVRIEEARSGVAYTAIDGAFSVAHARWGVGETFHSGLVRTRPHLEAGYVEGAAAGTLTIATAQRDGYQLNLDQNLPHVAPGPTGAFRILDGTVVASTVIGPAQRGKPTGTTDPTQLWRERPAGGSVVIQQGGDVTIGAPGTPLAAAFAPDTPFAADDPRRFQLTLPAGWFDGATITRLAITSGYTDDAIANSSAPPTTNFAPGGKLLIPTGVVVDLGDGGAFAFTGKSVELDGTLRAAGGTVKLKALELPAGMPWSEVPDEARPTIHLGAGGVIDVAGRWGNDRLDGLGAPLRPIDGGKVELTSYRLLLDPGSVVDVSGGARLDASGQKVTAGKGGAITLDFSQPVRPGGPSSAGELVLADDVLRGYAADLGGSLTIDAPGTVVVGADAGSAGSPWLFTPDFFTHGGFSSYTLAGSQGVLVTAGAGGSSPLAPSVESFILPEPVGVGGQGLPVGQVASLADVPSGALLEGFAARAVLPELQRRPMQLSLTAAQPVVLDQGNTSSLAMVKGAVITMEPGSSVSLAATGALEIDGRIETPGGSILVGGRPALGVTADYSRVHLGPEAQLLVPGYLDEAPRGELLLHTIQPAGRITLAGGEVVTDPGSLVDASGLAGVADLAKPEPGVSAGAGFVPTSVEGDAGSVTVTAGWGSLRGTLALSPGGPSGRGGSLSILGAGGLVVSQDGTSGAATQLAVSADALDAARPDDLTLSALRSTGNQVSDGNLLRFDGDVALSARHAITLVTPALGAGPTVAGSSPAAVTLSASYVHLLGSAAEQATTAPYAAGASLGQTLTVNADLIDVENALWLGCRSARSCNMSGFETTRLNASGDVRLIDGSLTGLNRVGLFTLGALSLQAAQVYVTSRQQLQPSDATSTPLDRAANDPGFLLWSADSITLSSNGRPAPVPLSFGERLTLHAPVITQGGVLRAPQGQLLLEAATSISLLPGSITSASLEGAMVPFGEITAQGAFSGYDQAGWAPTKSISLAAPSVAVAKGAVLDVSGGGDLLGYRFSPGNGGSVDLLATPGTFAVLPSLGSSPAPLGGVSSLRDPTLQVGDSVWLQGVPGLAAGFYTLLPAHDALLPGALLIRPLGGTYATAPASFTNVDGSVVAAGYRAVAGTPARSAGYGLFLVMGGDAIARHGQFTVASLDASATELAASAGAPVRTPRDAGAVSIDASTSLALLGSGRFDAPSGALLGNLDIAAPRIAVVGGGASAPDASYLQLDAEALTAFGAASLLLGGTRQQGPQGTTLTVKASEVVVDTGTATPWAGAEILVAAQGSITVRDGSVVEAQGTAPGDASPLLLAGDGALLRLSSGSRAPIVRTGSAGAAGDLVVGSATLGAAGALSLDGSRTVELAQGAVLTGRQFDLGSAILNLGAVPAGVPGTDLGPDTLLRLASSSDLLLRATDRIAVFGELQLGSRDVGGAPSLQTLTLDTARLEGHAGVGAPVTLTAGALTLRNGGAGSAAALSADGGTLTLDADSLILGPGQVQLSGFAAVAGRAGDVEVQGVGGLASAGQLTLATPLLRMGGGSRYALTAAGSLALVGGPGAPAPAGVDGLGGQLSLQGADVLIDTTVRLPAGVLDARSLGGTLRLGPDAVIDAAGRAVDLFDQVRFAPGGDIRLAAAGDLSVDAAALLDVSGAGRGGSAGGIELSASGAASVLGQLRGAAAPGYVGGAFGLDAGTSPGLPALLGLVAQGGFDRAVSLRLRQQDLDLSGTLRAHQVILQSDVGRVHVGGTVDASGSDASPDGGRIEVVGGAGVQVDGTLDARAGAATAGGLEPASGTVVLESAGGRVALSATAVVELSGGRSGGGALVLRAPRTAAGQDLAVDPIAGRVVGARGIAVQGVASYQPAAQDPAGALLVDDALRDRMLQEATAWLAGRDAMEARLAGGQGALTGLLGIAPGLQVTSPGALSLQSTIDLHGGLGGLGGPGFLGLRAGGDLTVGATLSDGFVSASRTAALVSGSSFDLRLEAGQDLTIAKGAMVRTGTGDLALSAGRDVVLADATSVVYTAGTRSPWATGFGGAPAGALLGEFPTLGGDVSIAAGRDVLAPLVSQATSAWLFRYGDTAWSGDASGSKVAQQASWSIVYQDFEQAVGALGGGDVRVRAGRDVTQLQVAIPTTGQLTTAPGSVAQPGDLVVRGGGDLRLEAGRDVRGGLFVLGRGHADIQARGGVLASAATPQLRSSYTGGAAVTRRPVGALFGLSDATATVVASSAIDVEAAFDPMRQGLIPANLSGGQGSSFWSYSDRASLDATSLAAGVTYQTDPWAAVDVSRLGASAARYGVSMGGAGAGMNLMYLQAPPILRLTALGGDVLLRDRFGGKTTLLMAPSAQGNLELLARDDVKLTINVKMEDVAAQYRHGPLQPFATRGDTALLGDPGSSASTNGLKGLTPLHADDPDPVRLYAVDGSVCADRAGACAPGASVGVLSFPTITLPKPLDVRAGRDVLHGDYQFQHNAAEALSIIEAGRDVFDVALEVTGPGTLLVRAGRDVIDHPLAASGDYSAQQHPWGGLGLSQGSGGADASNLALPRDRAADVYIMAGVAAGTDYEAFALAYLDPANASGVARTYLPELRSWMKRLDARYAAASEAELVAGFAALPPARRETFLDGVYFSELRQTGIEYNDPASPRYHRYDRGFGALALLFPRLGPPGAGGDVILSGKAVETWADGSITVLAPHGRVDVGTAFVPEGFDAAGGGIVTRRGGDIRVMAEQDIALYTSRVFTLQGGDITMWTSEGSITAGTGSKTSVSSVPLAYTMSNDGVITVDVFGLSTGAGIGVLDALQNAGDRPPRRLDLIAPKGEVNAGDAGIRVVGNLNIAALTVVGIENIQTTGTSVGVPKVDPPNVAALSSASSVAQAAAKEGVGAEAAGSQARQAADLPSIITVEVVGYETSEPAAGSTDGEAAGKKKRKP